MGYEDLQMILGGFVQVMEVLCRIFGESMQVSIEAGVYVCRCGKETDLFFVIFLDMMKDAGQKFQKLIRVYSSDSGS